MPKKYPKTSKQSDHIDSKLKAHPCLCKILFDLFCFKWHSSKLFKQKYYSQSQKFIYFQYSLQSQIHHREFTTFRLDDKATLETFLTCPSISIFYYILNGPNNATASIIAKLKHSRKRLQASLIHWFGKLNSNTML